MATASAQIISNAPISTFCMATSAAAPAPAVAMGSHAAFTPPAGMELIRFPQRMQMPAVLAPAAEIQTMRVPLIDAQGGIDPARQVDVDFEGLDRMSSPREVCIAHESIIQKAVATTVFIGATKGTQGWSGSGFIVDPQDLPINLKHYSPGTQFILTNHHVAGDAEKMWVVLPDGTEVWAEVAQNSFGVKIMDQIDDFALVAITPDRELPTTRLGLSSEMERGNEVYVAGFPRGLPNVSITHGIINSPEAETGELAPGLQTDAAINPGNSGGAMYDVKSGRVVGINTYGFRNADNMGFAQPIDTITGDIAEIGHYGKVRRGYSGVGLIPFPLKDRTAAGFTRARGFRDETGAKVKYIDPLSPAGFSGLKVGDVVTSIDVMLGGVVVGSFDINYTSWYQIGLMDRIIAYLGPQAEVAYHVYRPYATGGYAPEQLIHMRLDELTAAKLDLLRGNLQ